MTGRVHIRLCSVLAVETGGRTLTGHQLGSRKARTLLAFLAAARGRLVPIDQVIEALWPDGPPADPSANVATLVSRMRRAVGDGVLVSSGRAYGLDTRSSVDLDEAAALVEESRRRSESGEPALGAAAARRVLELLLSPAVLPDEDEQPWVLDVRREVGELLREARHVLAASVLHTDAAEAVRAAEEAVLGDQYDERAVRDLMRAQVATASVAAALRAYDDLARRLREELGIDPAQETSDLHLAILREQPASPEPAGPPVRGGALSAPVGRATELATIESLWATATEGSARLLLLEGQGGIGKTRLLDATAELALSVGGLVLRGRCHPGEQSLFLQPYVDALRPELLGQQARQLDALATGHTAALLALLPDLEELVEVVPGPALTPEIARRQAFDAVTAVLRRLSRKRPVLLAVDDLQDGAAATVDLLGYLAEHLGNARVLLAGAVRSEDRVTVARLAGRATVLGLGSLSLKAVETLATAAGLPDRAAEVLARTSGHSLSVVEYLRALSSGEAGIPRSLAAAVLARVERLDPETQELVRAASLLQGRIEPPTLARLAGSDEIATVRRCEALVAVGLLQRTEASYEFANDLAQECVREAVPPAMRVALHRRAADLLSGRPEAMAAHAHAAGDHARAAQGWLLAGQTAMSRSAVEDAVALLGRSVAAAEAAGAPDLRARALLARSGAHDAATSYLEALADIDAALELARECGDQRLEMQALRARGGDVPVALRLPIDDSRRHLDAGLGLARSLGDRRAEADFTARLALLAASRLELAPALTRAEAGLVRARGSASPEAVALALDGVKTVLTYLGEVGRAREVLAELVPQLRSRANTWLLQWAVFESCFPAAALEDWDRARALVDEALEVNRQSGYTAYAGYFRAHLGWFARLTGDLDEALVRGRTAVAETSPADHPWWFATATGLLAATLIEVGDDDEAVRVAARGLEVAGAEAPEAWRLRCLAPLAAASGSDDAYDEATDLLRAIDCPPGHAWVTGADCYLLLARAASRRGDHLAAEAALAALRSAVTDTWAPLRHRVEELAGQISSTSS